MSDRNLQQLTQAMLEASVGDLVGRLALSADRATRALGLYLFDVLEIEVFPRTAFGSDDELTGRLLFYEIQRTAISPKAVARILVALIPICERSTPGFRDEVFDELKLQCQNFAGECRAELKAIAKDVPIVGESLQEVARYFADLERAHNAGINAMEVTGHRRAIVQHDRLFSRRVSENAKTFSPLLSMMKKVSLLYGCHTSQFIDGQLHDAMPLVHMSSSMELPIVEFCDPEEMALRRFHASASINALIAGRQEQPPSEEVSDE
jgi:hypothetical protein